MGVRFQRRIKICKGVNLNVSKSGVGISLGMRGASISMGPRGEYVNLGIPDTGISSRTKLNHSTSEGQKKVSQSEIRNSSFIEGSSLTIKITKEGKEIAFFTAPDGTEYLDETMMRRIKKGDLYRETLEKVRKMKYEDMKNKNDSCIFIYKSSPVLITETDVLKERDNSKNIVKQEYIIHEFNEPEPREITLYDAAHAWALENVEAHFWNKRKRIREATNNKLAELFEAAKNDWNRRRDEYYESEKKNKIIKDKEYEEVFTSELF